MPKTEVATIDAKGRLQLPLAMREAIGVSAGSEVLLSAEGENRIVVAPVSEPSPVTLRIELGDSPGSLARLAQAIAKSGGDLLSSHSRSVARSKRAEWVVVLSSPSVKNVGALKKRLLAAGAVSVKAEKG
jgi:bifunctional DNA-binding transcriptional regulator/antitoxin component of YhaV-PrlF toxin-antitoxin module